MWKDEDPELPQIVRDIKRETEALIRLSDKAFIKSCKIAWEDDIEQPFATPREPVDRQHSLRHSLRSFLCLLARRLHLD